MNTLHELAERYRAVLLQLFFLAETELDNLASASIDLTTALTRRNIENREQVPALAVETELSRGDVYQRIKAGRRNAHTGEVEREGLVARLYRHHQHEPRETIDPDNPNYLSDLAAHAYHRLTLLSRLIEEAIPAASAQLTRGPPPGPPGRRNGRDTGGSRRANNPSSTGTNQPTPDTLMCIHDFRRMMRGLLEVELSPRARAQADLWIDHAETLPLTPCQCSTTWLDDFRYRVQHPANRSYD